MATERISELKWWKVENGGNFSTTQKLFNNKLFIISSWVFIISGVPQIICWTVYVNNLLHFKWKKMLVNLLKMY